MLAALPLLSFILLAVALHMRLKRAGRTTDWRFSALLAAVIWSVFLVAVTEMLSLGNLITELWLGGVWAAAATLTAILCAREAKALPSAEAAAPRRKGRSARKGSAADGKTPQVAPRDWKSYIREDILGSLGRVDLGLLLAVVVVLAVIFVTAVVSPPNNCDSMQYHLGRVEHWVQNSNVRHYPTHITRQITLAPMAEFVLLHLRLLSGGDRLANLVQFSAMVGCLIAVSWIAALLGASRRAQVFTVVVCATIPMGILQASTTQTDYVHAFWLTCLAGAVLALGKEFSWLHLLLAAGALALAVLTKAVAYVYALPLAIWLAVILLRTRRWGFWKPSLAILVIFLALNCGHWLRNYTTFGTLTGAFHGSGDLNSLVMNSSIAPKIVASNVIRNMSLHLTLPSPAFNDELEVAVLWLHRRLGVDPSDSRNTLWNQSFRVPESYRHEDFAPNTLHLVLLAAALVMLVTIRPRMGRELIVYVLCVLGASLLFCIILRWQPWHSRLHLPLFVLACPIIGLSLARLAQTGNSRIGWMRPAIAGLIVSGVLAGSLPFLLCNEMRPILGGQSIFRIDKEAQYLAGRPSWLKIYQSAADSLRDAGAGDLGLVMREGDLEYPLWIMLKNRLNRPARFEHVQVMNPSAKLAADRDQPPNTLYWSGQGDQLRILWKVRER